MPKPRPTAADATNRLARAAERAARLAVQMDKAREELHAAIRETYGQGVSVAAIARITGYTRQRVHQIVTKEE